MGELVVVLDHEKSAMGIAYNKLMITWSKFSLHPVISYIERFEYVKSVGVMAMAHERRGVSIYLRD